MFRPHIGICICHGKQRKIVVKKGYCQQGNDEKHGKVRKPLKAKKIYRLRCRVTGELEFFKSLWETLPHVSMVSGEPLGEFNVSYFAHVLPKKKFPKFRLEPENIVLLTIDEHYMWDNQRWKIKESEELMKKFKPLFELEELLLTKYKQNGYSN